MNNTKDEKEKLFTKKLIAITAVCVVIITIVGTVLLYLETRDKSTIMKHENNSALEAEIAKITGSQSASNSGYSPEIHGLININTADKETLMVLEGIGEKRAEAIIEYRIKKPFKKTSDIMNISGIGEKIYAKIKDKICVE